MVQTFSNGSARLARKAGRVYRLSSSCTRFRHQLLKCFRFPPAILAIPVVVCVVCAILGILCFGKREARRLSYFFLAAALIAGGLFAPAMFGDRIIVSPREIATTTGFWFAPTREGFVYQDVLRVRVTTYYDLKTARCPAWRFTIAMATRVSFN